MASGNGVADRGTASVIIVAGLLVMLPLLAWLQYRWIGEVSRAERDRLEAGLHQSVGRFTEELDTAVGNVFVELLMVRREPLADEQDILQRSISWRKNSRYRRLLHELYVTSGGPNGTDTLLRLDFEKAELVPAEWPPELAPIQERIQQAAAQPFRPPWATPMDSTIPVIAAPRYDPQPPGTPPGSPTGWAIAWLDKEYLTTELLPDLAERFFQHDYVVEIVSRLYPDRIIYQSDPGPPMKQWDLSAGLFQFRQDTGRGGRRGRFGGFGKGQRRTGPPPQQRMSAEAPPGPPGGGENGRWELRVKHRDGSLDATVARARMRNLLVSAGILALLTACVATLVVFTRRAQRLARLQMEFVAGVSHELRTPLTVIRSAGDNLADGVVAEEQQVRRYGAVIRDEGARLTQMVEQILRFAGIQSGRARYDLRPVELSRVLAAARETSETVVRKASCRLEQKVPDDLPPLLADSTALAHCFSNLITNAAKYAPEGGWIGIEAHPAGEMVEVSVEDHGPGIDREDLPHIFEPFYRGRKAIADQVQGAGMGLSLVKRIVLAHNGSVEVNSRSGEGARFTLRLPIANGNHEWDKESSS